MYQLFSHYRNKITLIISELLLMLGSIWLSLLIWRQDLQLLSSELLTSAVFCAAVSFSLVTLGTYQNQRRTDFLYELIRVVCAFIFALAILAFIFYLLPGLHLGRTIIITALCLALLLILGERQLLHRYHRRHQAKNHVWVLGTGRYAKDCSTLVKSEMSSRQLQIDGFIGLSGEQSEVADAPVYPLQGSLYHMARQHNISELIIAVQNRRGTHFPLQDLLQCKANGIAVSDIASLFERETGQIPIHYLQPSWLIFGEGFNQSHFRSSIKRDFDLLFSLAILLVSLPVMLLATIAILLDGLLSKDRGPVFYRQERTGLDGKPFKVIKFRSMRTDAEKCGTPQWSTENDPRITHTGRILRKFRIDELPQIFNVLKGEMSLVGPRPERPFFVEQLNKELAYYEIRHCVKPGITGWAQVRYQYGSTVDDAFEKLQYDLYYVKNHSLILDIKIVFETIHVVLLGKSGR